MVERHIFHDIGIKNICVDIVSVLPDVYRVTTIDFRDLLSGMTEVPGLETAINTMPVEKYSSRAKAVEGHKKYVQLLQEGWKPK